MGTTHNEPSAAIFGPRVAAFQAVDHAVRLGDPETQVVLPVLDEDVLQLLGKPQRTVGKK